MGKSSTDYPYSNRKLVLNIKQHSPQEKLLSSCVIQPSRPTLIFIWDLKEGLEIKKNFMSALDLEQTRLEQRMGSFWH
jgi:hypothetical protein